MAVANDKPEANVPVGVPVEGTPEMTYWDFRRDFCDKEGWRLRRTAPQTYEVLNREGKKLGMFKSGEGYYPSPEQG